MFPWAAIKTQSAGVEACSFPRPALTALAFVKVGKVLGGRSDRVRGYFADGLVVIKLNA